MRFLKLIPAVAALVACGCSSAPAAQNVELVGQVTDKQGRPVAGMTIYFAVPTSQPGIAGVGEHGAVVTDAQGRYGIKVEALYNALELEENDRPYRCGPLNATIPVAAFKGSKRAVANFVCPEAGVDPGQSTPFQ